LVSPFLITSEF